jgi:hypothetical protein
MNFVSHCCNSEIIVRHAMEYPLGGHRGYSYKYDACDSCGKETSPVEQCGACGVVGCKCEEVENNA